MALRNAVQSNRHVLLATGAALTAASIPLSVTLMSEATLLPPSYPWRHRGFFASFDHGAMRRGFQVYREVCATCHSLEFVRWRELAGVTHTKEEVNDLAKECMVMDGPDKEGEMFERPAKSYDQLPSPYENDAQGASANNGALPPDLSVMVGARHEGHDYVFALLTGYMPKPAGKEMMESLNYNPYFPGGGIAMPPPLQDDGVEYPDGTVATISQQARDVVQFLHWTSEPELEQRKKYAMLYMTGVIFFILGSGYHKRWKWSSLKTRKIAYV